MQELTTLGLEIANYIYEMAVEETPKILFGTCLSALVGLGAYKLGRHKQRREFEKAAAGNQVSAEIKITLLTWDEHDNGQGTKLFDLKSITKEIDLRLILPENLREELPKYMVEAARLTTPESPYIFDHLGKATEKYASLFKSKEEQEKYELTVRRTFEDQLKYIVPRQFSGDDFMQKSYHNGTEIMYAVLVHEQSDDANDLRLLLIPESYLEMNLPESRYSRVRKEGLATGMHFYDPEHRHTKRLELVRGIVERLKRTPEEKGRCLVEVPKADSAPQPVLQAASVNPDGMDFRGGS